MKVKEVKALLDAVVETGEDLMEMEVRTACGSDMMSDVLAYVKEEGLLLTVLVNPQVVRTAEMMDIKAIVFVRGKVPSAEMIELARERGMVLMRTQKPMYIACGELYMAGLVPHK